MFQLIENTDMAYQSAGAFVSKHILDESVGRQSVNGLLPSKLPCLIDWFVNLNWQRQKVLGRHICLRSTAKCLVYPKTNKIYPVAQYILRDASKIVETMQRSMYGSKNYDRIETDPKFDKVVAKCEEDNEPFLIRFRAVRGRFRDNGYIHMTVLNLATAKQLVYYKKNNKPLISLTEDITREINLQNEDVRREIDRVIVQAIEQAQEGDTDDEDSLPF